MHFKSQSKKKKKNHQSQTIKQYSKKNPTKISIKSKKGWLIRTFAAIHAFKNHLLPLYWFTILRRQSSSSAIHLNWDLHHRHLCIVGRKWTTSIKWFILLEIACSKSILLVAPLAVTAQRLQLVLWRLPADLSFFPTRGFPFWLTKPHVSIIPPASVRGCLLPPPPYISPFDLWLKHATPPSRKKTSIFFFDLRPPELMRRISLHFITLQPNPSCATGLSFNRAWVMGIASHLHWCSPPNFWNRTND